jgi:hypothetical protein
LNHSAGVTGKSKVAICSASNSFPLALWRLIAHVTLCPAGPRTLTPTSPSQKASSRVLKKSRDLVTY